MRPWPKNFKNLPLYFVSTEPIPRIHGAQTYQRTRLWVPQLGKIIYRIFFVLSQFLFSIAFFRTKMVHRVFFWHLGFAGIYIYIHIYIFIYIHIYIYSSIHHVCSLFFNKCFAMLLVFFLCLSFFPCMILKTANENVFYDSVKGPAAGATFEHLDCRSKNIASTT